MNRLMSDIEPASLALALLILLVAVLLGLREWVDRQGRPVDLPNEDQDHYRRRDRRRSTGLSILCILALGIVVGSRLPSQDGLKPNPIFLGIWLVIFGLIMTLLTLALVDWYDLRRFAQRKKSAIGRERQAILQTSLEQWKGQHLGQGESPDRTSDPEAS